MELVEIFGLLTINNGVDACFHIFLSIVRFFLRPATHRDISAPKAKLAQLMLQRLPVHAEDGSRSGDIATGFFETAGNVAAFELAAVVAKVRRVRYRQIPVNVNRGRSSSLPSDMIATRSITFFSSRTFPGQSYSINSRRAVRAIGRSANPYFSAAWRAKASASAGMSSRRSRNGAISIVTTCKR